MTTDWIASPPVLPKIPAELAKRHHVREAHDTRLRAAARLLQAVWLSDHNIPRGLHQGRTGVRKLGSRLSATAAMAGRNFLTPDLAALAHHVVAYSEPGALTGAARLHGNALSSAGVCVNTMGALALNHDLAARLLRILLPDLGIETVTAVRFEHSPCRPGQREAIDASAFDVCVFVTRAPAEGGRRRPCVLCFEFKYTEDLADSAPLPNGRYNSRAEASGLFKDPYHAALRVNPLQQLFREHLLAQGAVMRGQWPEAVFLTVAPAIHERAQRQAALYKSFLNPTLPGHVPFASLTLDAFVNAYAAAGCVDFGQALHARYLDFVRIDRLVAEAGRQRVAKWPAAAKRTPTKLVGTAA